MKERFRLIKPNDRPSPKEVLDNLGLQRYRIHGLDQEIDWDKVWGGSRILKGDIVPFRRRKI